MHKKPMKWEKSIRKSRKSPKWKPITVDLYLNVNKYKYLSNKVFGIVKPYKYIMAF